MEKTEKIGNVLLRLDNYSGADLYCDGDVEDELLEIVTQYEKKDFDRIIHERCKWPVFYHLSELRENCVEWLEADKSMSVLEIGAGCGAVTGVLAGKCGRVVCSELSKKRSLINANRHREYDNIEIIVGNFKELDIKEKFDIVTLIGVLEYAESYIGGADPYRELIKKSASYLKSGGRLVIAIENKIGLKYWAGCKEDHIGKYYESIEDYGGGGGVRTFTKTELEGLLKSSGVERFKFYYPYPDYKFTQSLYSDEFLPKKGTLTENMRNFDDDRLVVFDEAKAYDTIIESGLYPLFANSFLIIAEV